MEFLCFAEIRSLHIHHLGIGISKSTLHSSTIPRSDFVATSNSFIPQYDSIEISLLFRGLHVEMHLHTETRTREEESLSISHSNGSAWHTNTHPASLAGLTMGPKLMSSGNEYEIPRMELVDEQIRAIDPDAVGAVYRPFYFDP